MKQGDFTAAFASDLFESGVVAVPALLLEKYVYLGLSEKELAFILQILSLKQKHGHKFPSASEIISLGSFESQEFEELVDSLVQKNHLKIEKNEEDTYSLAPLFEHLSELWAQSQIACGVCDQKEVEPEELAVGELVTAFEEEFGRLLSPMETSQIWEWLTEDKFKKELIEEALKISVLRGVLNFRYVDSILRDWHKKGIKNLTDLKRAKGSKEIFKEKGAFTKKDGKFRSKYADVYLNQR